MLSRLGQRGVSLIELLIGLAIIGILVVLALPSYKIWILNAKIRNAAEGTLNGLQLARAEAVRRNTSVGFVITNTAPTQANVNTIVPINTGNNWMVRVYQPGGAYTAQDFIQGGELTSASSGAQNVIQRVDAAGNPYSSGPSNANVDTVIFGSLGRVSQVLNQGTVVTDIPSIRADFTNPSGGACAYAATPGPMRCLRVVLTTGGQIKLCDPSVSSPDPRSCS